MKEKTGMGFAKAITLCAVFFTSSVGLCATATLDETARFLAGKGATPNSSLAAYAQTQPYSQYAKQIQTDWRHFQQPNARSMRTWWEAYAPAGYSTVFYPFAGPDIATPLTLFPDADTYLLFGLESPGDIPDPSAMEDEMINAGLNDLRSSLDPFLVANYFSTNGMKKKLGRSSFNSVTALMMFLLAMNDCEVTGGTRIAVGPDLTLVSGTAADDSINLHNPPRIRIPGIELSFRKNHGKVQIVRYFMVNIADLAKNSSHFIAYLKAGGRYATVIKSAAYLMHTDSNTEPPPHFDLIRDLVLMQSDFIMQDDSGVPLKFFARDKWKLCFHGRYDAPIPLFSHRQQKNYRTQMQHRSTGKLSFVYGYHYKPGESNLMTAARIQ